MEASSSNIEKSAVNSAEGIDIEAFVWDSYIRLKATLSSTTDVDANLELVSKAFEELWNSLKSKIVKEEGQLWHTPLTDDTSRSFFFLVGLPTLPPAELANLRRLLKEWQKETSNKIKKMANSIEVKLVPRKVFLEHGFEVYIPPPPTEIEPPTEALGAPSESNNSKKKKESVPAAGNFKKIKGSNPAEVRRQFLEHSLHASSSSSSSSSSSIPNSSSSSNGKLRPGKEVLSRMKFDEAYDVEEFVVGYIDRKEGILEVSVREWESIGGRKEELMAYVKNKDTEVVVWDKARKIDLVFG